MESTRKFTGLAQVYAAGRSAYAEAFIESLYAHYGLSERSVIADVGTGTGKLAKQLLDKGSFVYGVEPNEDMRRIAIEALGHYKGFQAVAGTAADTTLGPNAVDFVTVAQAFHWFEVEPFRRECRRILRDQGLVFLIWNMRNMTSAVNRDCYALFTRYCPRFKGFGGGIQKDDARIRAFFRNQYDEVAFDHPLHYDREKFISRSLSGSYSLRAGDEGFDEYMDALNALFEKHAKDQVLTIANQTVAYIGSME